MARPDVFDPRWCSRRSQMASVADCGSARNHGGTPSFYGRVICQSCGRKVKVVIKDGKARMPRHFRSAT